MGYITLASALTLRSNDDADRQRAVAVLERALAYPVVDPDDWDLKVRLEQLRDKRNEEALTAGE